MLQALLEKLNMPPQLPCVPETLLDTAAASAPARTPFHAQLEKKSSTLKTFSRGPLTFCSAAVTGLADQAHPVMVLVLSCCFVILDYKSQVLKLLAAMRSRVCQ